MEKYVLVGYSPLKSPVYSIRNNWQSCCFEYKGVMETLVYWNCGTPCSQSLGQEISLQGLFAELLFGALL